MAFLATSCSLEDKRWVFDLSDKINTGGDPVSSAITEYLNSADCDPGAIIHTDGRAIVLDLGIGSDALGESLRDLPVHRFGELVDQAMSNAGTGFAFGRWGEPRDLYSSELFADDADAQVEPRTIHMGIDLFCRADTAVHAPLDGRIHIKANNTAELDYGPMLILEHETTTGGLFYSLYGHLSWEGVAHIDEGQSVTAGDRIATIGRAPENGNWPPHLHFQLILDLLDLGADFPGVALRSEQDSWLALSPLPAMFFPERDTASLDGRKPAS